MFFSLFECPHLFREARLTGNMDVQSMGRGQLPQDLEEIHITCCRFPRTGSFLAVICCSQRQDEKEQASIAAGKIKSRGQEEPWFCHNCTSSKAKTRGCFGIPLELLKEQDRLLPMLTLNRKQCDKGNSFVLEISCAVWAEGRESRVEA